MKKKNGFTLIELIAVIAILAIIITVSGISIVRIKKSILKNQRISLQAEIKAAAQSYHDETGLDTVPVGILLQIGAIQADTMEYTGEGYEAGDPVILDPVDGEPINCDAIYFDAEGNAKYEYDTGCSAEVISETSVGIYYQTSEGGTVNNYISGEWIASPTVILSAISLDKNTTFNWISTLSPDASHQGSKYEIDIPESGKIDGEYRLETNTEGIEAYQNFILRIDAVKPTIENAYVVDADEWKKFKYINATLIDNESLLAGYKVLLDSSDCTSVTDWDTAEIANTDVYNLNYKVTEMGNYTICVKDVAGNITKSENTLKVIKLDNSEPTIEVTVPDGTVYAKSKTATVTITDQGSNGDAAGFDGSTMSFKYGWSNSTGNVPCSSLTKTGYITTTAGSKTASTTVSISDYTGEGKIYVCSVADGIKDTLGNTLEADYQTSTSMYLDNEAPSIESLLVVSRGSGYNSADVNIRLNNISDNNRAGNIQVCISKSNSTSGCSWQSVTSDTFTQDNYNIGSDGSGSTVTIYAFAKDKLGNIMSTPVSGSYTIYKYCTSTYTSGYGSWGTCTAVCDGGTQYRDVYKKDNFYRGYTCPTESSGDSQSCNTRSCCTNSTIKYKNGSTCTVDCGGGTYNQLAYSTYASGYTIRCSSYDKSSGGSSCNTQACCSEGTYSYYTCTSDGYVQQRRYNSCLNKYEYRTTTTGCDSACYKTTYGSCSASCGTGTQSVKCYYYYAGSKYTDTSYESCYDDSDCCDSGYNDYIYGYRYSGCSQVYITTCQDTCNSNAKCKDSSGNTYTRANLTYSKPSSCSSSTSYTYDCNIRGNKKRTLSYTWDCTAGHKNHKQGYYIYCRRSDGTLKTASAWKSAGVNVGATLVCPTNPYTSADGWEIISG